MAALCLNYSPYPIFHTQHIFINLRNWDLVPGLFNCLLQLLEGGWNVLACSNKLLEIMPDRLDGVDIG